MSEIRSPLELMREAIRLSALSLEAADFGPFGAVIAREGIIVGKGHNKVVASLDPTAHAEVTAIRDACKNLQTFDLSGCQIYTSCEPCPMCLAAIYWARLDKIVFGATRFDAAKIGFSDEVIYEQINLAPLKRTIPSEKLLESEAVSVLDRWEATPGRLIY